MLGHHFTISLHYLSLYSERQLRVGSLICNRDTKNVKKWVPNLWNYPCTCTPIILPVFFHPLMWSFISSRLSKEARWLRDKDSGLVTGGPGSKPCNMISSFLQLKNTNSINKAFCLQFRASSNRFLRPPLFFFLLQIYRYIFICFLTVQYFSIFCCTSVKLCHVSTLSIQTQI